VPSQLVTVFFWEIDCGSSAATKRSSKTMARVILASAGLTCGRNRRTFQGRTIGGSVLMIRGGFSIIGWTKFLLITPKMKTSDTRDALKVHLKQLAPNFLSINFIFQQFDASLCASRNTKARLISQNIKLF
jgi:hypothetical protein